MKKICTFSNINCVQAIIQKISNISKYHFFFNIMSHFLKKLTKKFKLINHMFIKNSSIFRNIPKQMKAKPIIIHISFQMKFSLKHSRKNSKHLTLNTVISHKFCFQIHVTICFFNILYNFLSIH